ncbi:MAG: hypothetical protein IIC96_16420 [Chloroflexi bacterium]|nr:hypothetical protein [Chloroflexota bacterium]
MSGRQRNGQQDLEFPTLDKANVPITSCAARQALIAQAMGIDISEMTSQEAGLAAADGVATLSRSLGSPRRLRDGGVPEDGLGLIAAAKLHDRDLPTIRKPVHDAGPMMSVLRDSW